MAVEKHQSIVDAIDKLAEGKPLKSDGRITAVNVAREACISKATLYRAFEDDDELRKSFEGLRKGGVRPDNAPVQTLEEANRALKQEVKLLRAALAEKNSTAEVRNKTKANQIQVLWSEVQRLEVLLARRQSPTTASKNVVSIDSSLRTPGRSADT